MTIGGTPVTVVTADGLPVFNGAESSVDSKDVANSSQAVLDADEVFTGQWVTNSARDIALSASSDVAGVITMQFSNDGGATITSSFPITVAAGVHKFRVIEKLPRSHRIIYTNGPIAQASMDLATYTGEFRQPSAPLNATIAQDADAIVVRALSESITLAEGKMAGYSVVNKFGKNSDIDTGSVPEDIWEGGGLYTGFPDTAGELIEVLSSSANDSSAGTGARTVQLQGLDENFELQSEIVTLNGTTPVDTVGTYVRMHTARVLSAGSGQVNEGTITFRHTTTTANVFAGMLPGKNQTNVAAYTIPAGKTGYIRRIHGSLRRGNAGTADGSMWIRNFGEVFRSRRPFTFGVNSRLIDEVSFGLRMGEKTDITMRIDIISANNGDVTGGFDIILVDN